MRGLRLVRDVAPQGGRQSFGGLGHGERLGTGDVVGLAVVPRAGEDTYRRVGNVVPRDPRDPPLPGRHPDDVATSHVLGDFVHVQALAQEGERESCGADVLFGVEMLPREDERRVRRRTDEGEVDDPLDAHRGSGSHGGDVLLDPVVGGDGLSVHEGPVDDPDGVVSRDEKERLDPRQGPPHSSGVAVAGHACDPGPGQLRRPCGIPDDESLLEPVPGQAFRYPAPHLSGRSCYRKHDPPFIPC